MTAGELFPLISGIVLGAVAAFTGSAHRRGLMAVVICLAALAATIGSGEYKLSWAYLLVDAMIVLAAACASFVVAARVSWAR